MPEFLTLLPPEDALNRLLEHLDFSSDPELVATSEALMRVTANPVAAPHPLPEFPRSTVDGFALRAMDTHGANESLPAYLPMVGEVPMGASPTFSIQPSECALIHTGGMLPMGADAVVMVEYTQTTRNDEVEILHSVAKGENVIQVGEDVRADQVVIPKGTILRPAEIGGLMALGFTQIEVAKCPRVAIISSGDEVIPPEHSPSPGEVRDINTYTLSAVIQRAGGIPVPYGIISDQQDTMLAAVTQAHQECDMVVVTAGSSASTRDLTAAVFDQLGNPGVLVHGINTRPGKPTILGVCSGKAVIGLPGNPVSALVNANLFVRPILIFLTGSKELRPKPYVPARLSLNLASVTGREDWIPIKLIPSTDGYQAEPIFGKSNLIFTLVNADGLLRIPPDANGLSAGTPVKVFIL
ncbi:MAG: gephyrin-like molybdotransferase Glp [Chloroflexota bacterium]